MSTTTTSTAPTPTHIDGSQGQWSQLFPSTHPPTPIIAGTNIYHNQPPTDGSRAVLLGYTPETAEERSKANMTMGSFPVQIRDLRARIARPDRGGVGLDTTGFDVVEKPAEGMKDEYWYEDAKIEEIFIPQMMEWAKELTGAHTVALHGFNVRKSVDEFNFHKNPARQLPPAFCAHVDSSPEGASEKVADITKDWPNREQLKQDRLRMIQFWKPIVRPAYDTCLTMVDHSSTDPDDYFPTTLVRKDKPNLNSLMVKHSPQHRWYAPSELQPTETIIFKGYDSVNLRDPTMPSSVAHAAYKIPQGFMKEGVPPRESIEVRVWCWSKE